MCDAARAKRRTADGRLARVPVVAVADWLGTPIGCALLADFDADVVTVEPAPGDSDHRIDTRDCSFSGSKVGSLHAHSRRVRAEPVEVRR